MIRRRLQSSVNLPQTITFPVADIGSDHDLVMMTFCLRLKRAPLQTSKRMKYNIDGLKAPNLMQQFNAILGGKFHQFTDLMHTDIDVDRLTLSTQQQKFYGNAKAKRNRG